MANKFTLKSFIRSESADLLGSECRDRLYSLGSNQPLLLNPEPTNHKDSGAVIVCDLMTKPCGYLVREHAFIVSALIRIGTVLMAKTNGPCACRRRPVLVWSEGEEIETYQEILRKKSEDKSRRRIKTGDVFYPVSGSGTMPLFSERAVLFYKWRKGKSYGQG